MASLVEALPVGPRLAPSRVVFGPHVTNLGRGRRISGRHLAYYETRAAGGTGVLVLETASVHPSDWPYERAPLAAECAAGWSAVAGSCRPFGTVVLAGLGHRGGQGSSAYSQAALWAPSAVADVHNREVPMVMEEPEIRALVDGFRASAELAMAAGLAGVEVDAGATSLLRQFHSGLTNHRDDAYGADRLRLTREVLTAVRDALGAEGVLGLRMSCDELAPWAGVTPEQAAGQLAELAGLVDMLVVVRGGPYARQADRPDGHTPANFNRELCRAMREAVQTSGSGDTRCKPVVVLQGSVVDAGDAQAALDEGVADAVEMTRAQIADPRIVARLRAGSPERIRPCILCNQECRVDDVRNPIVSCVGEPRSGHETDEPDVDGDDQAQARAGTMAGLPTGRGPERRPSVLVVGGGPAGLECARVLATRGVPVRLVERAGRLGGLAAQSAVIPGRSRLAHLVGWLVDECQRRGVQLELGRAVTPEECDNAERLGTAVVLATGSRPAPLPFPAEGPCTLVDAADLLATGPAGLPDGEVVVHDPVGGPVGVGVCEWLSASGRRVALVTPDPVAGSLLARTGDLADANVRLERAGVRLLRWARIARVTEGRALVEDVWTGATDQVPATVVVDCGHRLPEESLARARPHHARAGDCVAPRSILEAVLEGRRRALELAGAGSVPAGNRGGSLAGNLGGSLEVVA